MVSAECVPPPYIGGQYWVFTSYIGFSVTLYVSSAAQCIRLYWYLMVSTPPYCVDEEISIVFRQAQ